MARSPDVKSPSEVRDRSRGRTERREASEGFNPSAAHNGPQDPTVALSDSTGAANFADMAIHWRGEATSQELRSDALSTPGGAPFGADRVGT